MRETNLTVMIDDRSRSRFADKYHWEIVNPMPFDKFHEAERVAEGNASTWKAAFNAAQKALEEYFVRTSQKVKL